MEIEPKLGKSKFHGMIREVDLLRSRIAELEDGACRYNCQKEKAAFLAGAEWGLDGARIPTLQTTAGAYNQWVRERE